MVNKINNISKNSFYSLSINILDTFINFLLYLILAKYLGNIEFGKYVFIISLIKFVGLPIIVGYPYFILRQASYINKQKSKEYNFLLSKNIYILFIYLSLLITSLLLFKFFNQSFLSGKFSIFLLGTIIIIPSLSINSSISAIIRSTGGEIKGQVFEKLIPSIIFIGLYLVFAWSYKFESHRISIFLFSSSSVLSLLFSLIQIKGILSWEKLKTKNFVSFIFSDIKESALIVIFQIFVLFNNLLPLIILGFYERPEIVGNYQLAIQISAISGIVLHSINKIVQPRFAKNFSKKQFVQMEKIALRSNRLTVIYSFLISIFIFIFYKKFISIFFGTDFLIPKITFFIILLTPIVNSCFGSVGAIINMTGNEKVAFKWCGIALIIGLFSNLFFIPMMGINGAAISTLFASFIRGFALWRKSFTLLKVKSSYILNEIFKL